jgi:hypothetical protein
MITIGLPVGENVSVNEMEITYTQERDCDDSSCELQKLEVKLITQLSDDDYYYVIKTDRWAINDIDELIKVLEDFKKRVKG